MVLTLLVSHLLKQVVERLFSLLSDCMWESPVAQAKHTIQVKEKAQEMKLQVTRWTSDLLLSLLLLPRCTDSPLMFHFWQKQGDSEEEDENLPIQEVSFDPEKAHCCIVENGQILTHGSGGKGYGLASTGVTSGCYQWKVRKIKGLYNAWKGAHLLVSVAAASVLCHLILLFHTCTQSDRWDKANGTFQGIQECTTKRVKEKSSWSCTSVYRLFFNVSDPQIGGGGSDSRKHGFGGRTGGLNFSTRLVQQLFTLKSWTLI